MASKISQTPPLGDPLDFCCFNAPTFIIPYLQDKRSQNDFLASAPVSSLWVHLKKATHPTATKISGNSWPLKRLGKTNVIRFGPRKIKSQADHWHKTSPEHSWQLVGSRNYTQAEVYWRKHTNFLADEERFLDDTAFLFPLEVWVIQSFHRSLLKDASNNPAHEGKKNCDTPRHLCWILLEDSGG